MHRSLIFYHTQLAAPTVTVPGVGSSREQVDSFDEQLEVLLVPALPARSPSTAGLVGAASCLPRLDLGLLLPLQLGVHVLHLRKEAALLVCTRCGDHMP